MSKPLILVTAAAGKTGAPVARQLLERGFPVRALVRRRDDRSERLEKLGAEVVLGAFLDLASMRKAMQGVERVYFCYPPQVEGLVEANLPIADWGRIHGEEVGLPEFLVTHLKGVAEDHQNGVLSATDVVERIAGHAPQPLDEFVRLNRALFESEGVESHA